MDDDWDLQAVVRCYCATTNTTTSSTATTAAMEDPFSFFASVDLHHQQHDSFLSFPDLFEPRTGVEELEQLYKPFFPKFEPISRHENIPSASINPPLLLQQQQLQQQKQQQSTYRSNLAVSNTSQSQSHTPRPKRRKNQQKRVVCQVPAEGLSSDMWAWRKYGQKPIKGSPYPRGYYRCSSSKGCLARKQVERSRTDPGMFVITYTAEHNHPVPTHRNSLAGSTRNKISTPQRAGAATTTTGDSDPATTTSSKPSSPASTTGQSPTSTPLAGQTDEDLAGQQSKRERGREEEDQEEMIMDELDDEGEGEVLIPEGLLTDDLFNGLEELAGAGPNTAMDDCFSDHFWFTNNAAAAAGGV